MTFKSLIGILFRRLHKLEKIQEYSLIKQTAIFSEIGDDNQIWNG